MSQVKKTFDPQSQSNEKVTCSLAKNNIKFIIKKDFICCICQHGSSNGVLSEIGYICPTSNDAISSFDNK